MNAPSDTLDYPTLSRTERDRRFARTRAFLEERDLSCLLLFGLKSRERYECYLSNEQADGVVVFPVDGEPIYLTWGPHRITRRMATSMAPFADQFWIQDLRSGPYGPGIVEVVKSLGLDRSRIGVFGLDTWGPAEMEGIVTYRQWSHVLENLPDAEFVEVSFDYSKLMLVRSPEEQALFRFAANIGEKACQSMLDMTQPGISESEIYTEIQRVINSHCAIATAPHLIISMGTDDVGWGQPTWTYWGGRSRVVEAGWVVQAEIFPCYGGIETQQQMSIAFDPVTDLHRELADIARQSHEAGVAAVKPGRTFGQVCAAMMEPIEESGCWNLTPLIHTLSPLGFVSVIGHDIQQMPGLKGYPGVKTIPVLGGDIMLEPGMTFAFEPNACRSNHRINIGGTVMVTENGCEELNHLPNHMNISA